MAAGEMRDLDALLPSDEPHATLHDARLWAFQYSESASSATLDWVVCVGDPDAADSGSRERTRAVRMSIDGVSLWDFDQPLVRGAWLTGFDPIRNENSGWLLYFSDTNSFGRIDGQAVRFEWVDV